MNLKLIAIIAIAGLAACSHTPPVQDFANTANPGEEIQKLDTDMTSALRDQVEILSPKNYENARLALKDAKSDLSDQKDSAKTLHQVAKGRAYLDQALAVAKTEHEKMEDVIEARQKAIDAGAQKYYSKEFATADRDLREVTEDGEKGDYSEVQKYRGKLQGDYLAVELLSIKMTNLGQSRTLIDQAVKDGAKKYAPRTLAIAEKSYQDTDAFINANRHDAQVATKSAATLAAAQHVSKITQNAKMDKKVSPEDIALQMENKEGQVAATQNELSQKDSELKGKDSELQNKDSQLSGAALALAATQEKEQKEKAFQQKYEDARAQFNENEAEVYKQGDALVIRLKALAFPKGKTTLQSSNFALLAKVEKVMKDFGDSKVTVEGHTDSVGGKAANEKLSTARAEAVREYFVANSVEPADKITAIGYDFQKPLASNKTAAGRAQNRRVDIRIEPDKSTSL